MRSSVWVEGKGRPRRRRRVTMIWWWLIDPREDQVLGLLAPQSTHAQDTDTGRASGSLRGRRSCSCHPPCCPRRGPTCTRWLGRWSCSLCPGGRGRLGRRVGGGHVDHPVFVRFLTVFKKEGSTIAAKDAVLELTKRSLRHIWSLLSR